MNFNADPFQEEELRGGSFPILRVNYEVDPFQEEEL